MQDYSNYTDEELIEMHRTCQENTAISDYLIEKYKNLVRKKARAMYLIGAETDDLIQEGMIGLFKAIRDYRPEKGAAFQSFANLCIDRQMYHAVESSNRQKHQPLNAYVSLSLNDNEEGILSELVASSAETVVLDREDAQIMQEKIMKCLSPLENQVLASYLKGNDYLKIAQQLGRSPKSVDNALQRIRGKVRECILGKEK
ncbi:MAG: sigma-70 family RNA polymerase sigma factor [Eubacteriales bacterium]|nr:sigma-70 family RNA polymerase sigma factor [Eubacteriales bacterium]